MGFEPMNTGFADQRVSHFATGALAVTSLGDSDSVHDKALHPLSCVCPSYSGCAAVRRYGFTVL